MSAIQRWGNKRCNLYWEAHLKAGHVPAEHKVESFVRSKYEMRRWAKDGPPPEDPSTLEDGGGAAPAAPVSSDNAANGSSGPSATSQRSTTSSVKAPSAIDLLGGDSDAAPVSKATTRVTSSSGSLLDDFPRGPSSASQSSLPVRQASGAAHVAAQPAPSAKPTAGGGGGLFDLDWQDGPASSASVTSPTGSSATTGGTRGSKNDILSLFATGSKPAPATYPLSPSQQRGMGELDAFGGLNLSGSSTSGAASQPKGANANPWSPSGTGADQRGSMGQSGNVWGSSTVSADPWGSVGGATSGIGTSGAGHTRMPSAGDTSDIWGNMTSGSGNAAPSGGSSTGKNDAFADIWSDFK